MHSFSTEIYNNALFYNKRNIRNNNSKSSFDNAKKINSICIFYLDHLLSLVATVSEAVLTTDETPAASFDVSFTEDCAFSSFILLKTSFK